MQLTRIQIAVPFEAALDFERSFKWSRGRRPDGSEHGLRDAIRPSRPALMRKASPPRSKNERLGNGTERTAGADVRTDVACKSLQENDRQIGIMEVCSHGGPHVAHELRRPRLL